MDSESSANPAAFSFAQARDALRSCQGTLLSKKPDFDHVLAVLQPFEACDGFTGANPEQSAALTALIRATLGDCYRENQNYEKAAEFYRRAGDHRPIVGFQELYAEMVLKQGMQEHYGPALDCLRAAEDDSCGVPFLERTQFHLVRFWQDVRSLKFRNWFRNPFKSRYLIRKLSHLIR